MKSKAEIRQHVEDLETFLRYPCSCSSSEHLFECRIGAMMISAVLVHLKWLLGEAPEHEEHMAEIHRRGVQNRAREARCRAAQAN